MQSKYFVNAHSALFDNNTHHIAPNHGLLYA